MHGNSPFMFYYCADPDVYIILLKIVVVRAIFAITIP